MRDYVRLTGVLLIICVVAAGVLGVTNAITHDKIIEQLAKERDEARRTVLPDAMEFELIDESSIGKILEKPGYDIIDEVFEGITGGEVVGYTVKTEPKGYGGTVEIIIGVDTSGKVRGVKVGENSETPGLGKNAMKPNFQMQYEGKDWDDGVVLIKNGVPKDNEVLSISGATVTSTAVTEGVNAALDLAKELLKR